MLKEYAFSAPSGAKRANDVPHLAKLQARAQPNKTRVTMWIDEDVVAAFRARATKAGAGCQTEMNRALREAATGTPLTAENLAAVVTKAVAKASRRPVASLDEATAESRQDLGATSSASELAPRYVGKCAAESGNRKRSACAPDGLRHFIAPTQQLGSANAPSIPL